jgi:hypothetical protein
MRKRRSRAGLDCVEIMTSRQHVEHVQSPPRLVTVVLAVELVSATINPSSSRAHTCQNRRRRIERTAVPVTSFGRPGACTCLDCRCLAQRERGDLGIWHAQPLTDSLTRRTGQPRSHSRYIFSRSASHGFHHIYRQCTDIYGSNMRSDTCVPASPTSVAMSHCISC